MDLFNSTKVAAYHLWEDTACEDALNLWYCAEDIACYLEQSDITNRDTVEGIRNLGFRSEGYVWFVQNIAFRLHTHTGNPDELANWYAAERLLASDGWLENIIAVAQLFKQRNRFGEVRSEKIRSFYAAYPQPPHEQTENLS